MTNDVKPVPTEDQLNKYESLKNALKAEGKLAVAFSSGVDSAFLLYAAHEALGENVIAITATAPSFPQRETDEAIEFCRMHGIEHVMVEIRQLDIPGFKENPKDRCYICKKALFERMMSEAETRGISRLAEGSNLDDNGDYRPGLKAIEELGILSPLRDIGFTKQDIRQLSGYLGLPAWNKPSFACLSTRFVYGETITEKKLQMVGRAEQLLLDLGFGQVRVRIHGTMARIEVLPEEFGRLMRDAVRERVVKEFKALGFTYVTMDLAGYRTGSMNEGLT